MRTPKHQSADDHTTDAARLARVCPDLEEWPQSWRFNDADIALGEQIVASFKPFLLWLLDQQPSSRTFKRHRDNLWLIGGEIIRQRWEDPPWAGLPVSQILDVLIEEDGGPLIWPRITETDQKSLDTTCSKLYRFLHTTKSAW